MAKRGRPPLGRGKRLRRLIVDGRAIAAFERARVPRESYEGAVESAVAHMHECWPNISYSATRLKEALHRFQPRGASEVFHFIEDPMARRVLVYVGPPRNLRVNRKDRSLPAPGRGCPVVAELFWQP